MHSEWLLATHQRSQVHPLAIDNEVVGARRRAQQGTGGAGLGRERRVKSPFIHDVSNRLLRRVGELGAIPGDRFHPPERAYHALPWQRKLREGVDTDDTCTENLRRHAFMFFQKESVKSP